MLSLLALVMIRMNPVSKQIIKNELFPTGTGIEWN